MDQQWTTTKFKSVKGLKLHLDWEMHNTFFKFISVTVYMWVFKSVYIYEPEEKQIAC